MLYVGNVFKSLTENWKTSVLLFRPVRPNTEWNSISQGFTVKILMTLLIYKVSSGREHTMDEHKYFSLLWCYLKTRCKNIEK